MSEELRAPFPWYGGKSRAAPLIWPRFGGVPNYVEPFAGSLAVLLTRPHPPGIETINDWDCYVSNFWRAVTAAPAAVARWADWPVNECVPGGTMIATPAGYVPVEAIRPGMVVWGERDGRPVPSVVRAIKHNQATDFRQVGPLWLTGNHPVWTREHGYVEADSLAPGMHIATLDRPPTKSDLVMLYSDYGHEELANLQPKRSAHRDDPIRWCYLPGQEAVQRAPIAGSDRRSDASRLLDTLAHRRWGAARLHGPRPGAGRRLAGAGALLDCNASRDVRLDQSNRWRRGHAGLYSDTRTTPEMVGHASGGAVRAGATLCHAGSDTLRRGASEDQRCGPRSDTLRRGASEAFRRSHWEAPQPRPLREAVGSEARKGAQRRPQAQDRRCYDGAKAGRVCRDRADRRIDHRRLTGAGGERSVGLSGHSEGWALQRVALPAPVAVFNFETTTHNYFAAGVLVHNCDLHARHRWLLNQSEFRARLRTDPDYYDPKIAGWWVWGISQWIGSGWCSEAWYGDTDDPSAGPEPQAAQQVPNLRCGGMGVHATGKRPSLGRGGRGVHRATAENLDGWFAALSARLRRVRVCCGDWTRVLGPTPTEHNGVTAILLDPPYSHRERDRQLYGVEQDVAADVADWARAHGDNPRLRIALCGYDGEHVMPATWRVARWKANGGYGNQATGRGRANAARETIWFSPHCLPAVEQQRLW